MPGDRAQTWFREVIAELRQSWRPGLPWEAVIELREKLQAILDEVVNSRPRKPARTGTRCPHCGSGEMRPVITVRAVLLAVGRFGIESEDSVRQMDKAWAEHRALHQLNLYGRSGEVTSAHAHKH